MNIALALLIVAIDPDAPTETCYPGATTVFHCNFDASWDKNFDTWPDNWTRRRGRGYPHYVEIFISEEPSPRENRCLRIDLDGEGAVAYGPHVKVDPRYSYVLEGSLKTQGLKHDRAWLSLVLLDEHRRKLETFSSVPVRDVLEWKRFRLGPIVPSHNEVRWAVVGLHLEPGDRQDLVGSAMFDELWLGQLPRMSIELNSGHHVYRDPSQVEVICTASGFVGEDPAVRLFLEDVFGNRIAETEPPMELRAAGDVPLFEQQTESEPPLSGRAVWKPPLPGPGFYRIWAVMQGHEAIVHRQAVTLAVVECQEVPSGEFGWSLPNGGSPLTLQELAELLPQAGIAWAKFPLWYDEKTSEEDIARLVAFGEHLSSLGIELIGMLHDPPPELRSRYDKGARLTAAEIFSPSPSAWSPSLEPVMMRFATQVRWWQLGNDKDTSFVGYPNLDRKIRQVKSQLDRIGLDVNLAMGWRWMNRSPQTGDPPWKSLSLSASPPLTHQELEAYLNAARQPPSQQWIVLEPLAKTNYSLQSRANDLVRRMVSAKIHGAEAVFIPDPFDPACGLMNTDGTPGELFLPWRTTALLLSGADYVGSIQLPGGSQNRIFARGDSATMIVWNQEPVEEILYLGEHVQQVDLWSRRRTPQQQEHRQVIEAGPLPSFVTGVNLAITRWRQSCSFAEDRIPSVFGGRRRNVVQGRNDFDTGVAGQIKLVAPGAWSLRPDQTSFRLAQGERFQLPFEILLPYHATSGSQELRADFEVQADQIYRFSVYREIRVGLGDVYIECATRQNEAGELEIEQRFVNETANPVGFRCELFVPNRRRLRTQVVGLGQGQDVQTYRLRDGSELLGQTVWLRAEEIGGPRVLNYRFRAEP